MILGLTEKQELTAETSAYTFEPRSDFVFKCGQFVQLRRIGDPQKLARSFSMASSPQATHITFVMKNLPDGHMSGFLAAAPIGTTIEASNPLGRFTLDTADTDRVFIATGTGLAPIMSFIECSCAPRVPTRILFGCRDEERLFWQKKLPSDALITLSRPSPAWSGLSGRVTDHVPTLIAEHSLAAWYICGNPEMVKEVRAQLIAAGVAPHAIHFEIY